MEMRKGVQQILFFLGRGWHFAVAVCLGVLLALPAWAKDLGPKPTPGQRPKPEPFFTQIDWDYPFLLEGFDKDILSCGSIEPHFEGDKLVLRCAGSQEPAPPNVPAPVPAFDAAAYLEKRYGAKPGTTGPLHTPLVAPSWLKNRPNVEDMVEAFEPSENIQWAVPTFCQTYFQDGKWRALLLVSMYYRPKQTNYMDMETPYKGQYHGYYPLYYVAHLLSYRDGAWKTTKELRVPDSKPHSPYSHTGWSLFRLWRLANGGHVLLEVRSMQYKDYPEMRWFNGFLYVLNANGELQKPLSVEVASRDYMDVARCQWDELSTITVTTNVRDIVIAQSYKAEDQCAEKPHWSSQSKTKTVQIRNGKAFGEFFPPHERR